MAEKTNKVELWSGYEVEVSPGLFKDADFLKDYSDAQKNQDFSTLTTCIVALAGGKDGKDTEKVYNDIRAHIIAEKGRFDVDALGEILEKITNTLPKDGGRAQSHSWRISK